MTSVQSIYLSHSFHRGSQSQVMFCKKGVLKIVAKFKGKNLCQDLFLIKVQTSSNLVVPGKYTCITEKEPLANIVYQELAKEKEKYSDRLN